jgi:hypothetical protein
MAGPGCRRDQVPIHIGLGKGLVHLSPFGSGAHQIGLDGGIGRAELALHDTSRCQYLLPVADGGDGLVRFGKVPDDVQHVLVQTDVLRGAAPRNHQAVIVLGLDLLKGGVDGEIVPPLLAVGLVVLKVVDGGAYTSFVIWLIVYASSRAFALMLCFASPPLLRNKKALALRGTC